ncbi:hypothetical protein HDU87_000583 [Geranomyces variabilis]|uniref:F-box domain-containing protein n=1 Tax=Geranomyces variabilis TaxID=109894 RepID=A0AAD5TCH2_9FUNG|nr:hypothetical protein HDU87_000583 [Geranomyces variabilis]
MDSLGPAAVQSVLAHVALTDPVTIARCARVCRSWNALLAAPAFWKKAVTSTLDLSAGPAIPTDHEDHRPGMFCNADTYDYFVCYLDPPGVLKTWKCGVAYSILTKIECKVPSAYAALAAAAYPDSHKPDSKVGPFVPDWKDLYVDLHLALALPDPLKDAVLLDKEAMPVSFRLLLENIPPLPPRGESSAEYRTALLNAVGRNINVYDTVETIFDGAQPEPEDDNDSTFKLLRDNAAVEDRMRRLFLYGSDVYDRYDDKKKVVPAAFKKALALMRKHLDDVVTLSTWHDTDNDTAYGPDMILLLGGRRRGTSTWIGWLCAYPRAERD